MIFSMSDSITIKVRLYPTSDQRTQLDRTFGSCRFLYNQMLNEHNDVYRRLKDDKTSLYTHKYKTEAEYKTIFPFLKDADSITLQSAREHLTDAFVKFFQNCKDRKVHKTTRIVGYPHFKCKHDRQAFTTKMTNNNIQIDFKSRQLKIPKIKSWIKYHDSRIFTEAIHSVTVSKTKSGQYYASILIARENPIAPMAEIHEEKVIAFDMSMKDFLVTKEYKLENPRFFRQTLHKIQKAHRKVSRSVKGSKNCQKSCRKLAVVYEKYVNQKKDWTHKITKKLANDYDAVILEDLNVEGMKRFNKGYAKSVTKDFSWGEFSTILNYKLTRQGKYLQKAGRFFPSSQLCSHCRYQYHELTLDQREWTCPHCGTHHDRDINASQNLLKEGIRLLESWGITLIRATVGTTESDACGDRVRLPEMEATVVETRKKITPFMG